MTLTVMRGLPGSGKSTHARAIQRAADGPVAVVSRDMLREHAFGLSMGPGDQMLDRDGEAAVTVAVRAMVEALLAEGVSVIVDGTHLRDADVQEWESVAAEHGASYSVQDMGGISVEECIRRDAARAADGGRHVGEGVIRAMAASGRPVMES